MQITPLHTSIEKLLELKKGIVVLETPNGFPLNETNLYLISQNGDILWKAEKPTPNVLFTKLRLNEDSTISTFTNNGQFCEIDMETGKIISSSNFS
jgi:outer membrane protein assembly factor BamB